jgi:hypothetical protein
VARVKAIAAQTRYSYGSRRIAKQLQADGFAVGRYKARRLMQQAAVMSSVGKAVPGDDRQPASLSGRAEPAGAAI